MSFKRSPLLSFEPAHTQSPPMTRRGRGGRRNRASTGEAKTGFVLVDQEEGAIRTAHYRFYVANLSVVELRTLVFTKIRHPEQLDKEYDNISVSVAESTKLEAKAELLIQVTVSRDKKWTSTGSDIYLYYLLEMRKNKVEIVSNTTEVSDIIVDRIAAHRDYTLLSNRRCS